MPIKDKIELLTPEERKELEGVTNKIGHTSREEFSRWIELRAIAHKEFLLNQTPEERKAWEEMNARYDVKMKMMNGAF